MKKEIVRIPLLLCAIFLVSAAFSQTSENVEKEEFKIMLVDVKDGKKVTIDTSFNTQEEMDQFMKDRGIDHQRELDHEELIWASDDEIKAGKEKIIIKKVIHKSGDDVDIDLEVLDHGSAVEILEMLDVENMENIKFEVHEDSDGNEHTQKVKVFVLVKSVKVEDLTDEEYQGAKIEPSKRLELSSLDISPNPATDKLTIKIKSDNKGSGILRILNMTGKELYQTNLEMLNGQYELPLGNLSSGMYILQVVNGDKSMSQKLIIQD
jgi:hypothetical protein